MPEFSDGSSWLGDPTSQAAAAAAAAAANHSLADPYSADFALAR